MIAPVERRGERGLGLKMRRAYFGGPVVARSLLDMERPIEPTAPPLDRLDQLIARVCLQAEIAMAYAANTPSGLMHIMRAAVRLLIAGPQIELAMAHKKHLEAYTAARERELSEVRQQLEATLAENEELRKAIATTSAPAGVVAATTSASQTHAA